MSRLLTLGAQSKLKITTKSKIMAKARTKIRKRNGIGTRIESATRG
jgi:hypothetical protein